MGFEIPFGLSICPRIRAEEDRLTASTSWIQRILMLGLSQRQVVVDRQEQTVTLRQRTAWFFSSVDQIPFAQIAGVTYGYEDEHPFASMFGTHDSVDRYVVGLRVYGREELRLFSFVGEGYVTNNGPLPDWWHWEEYAFDLSGSQARESKVFVQLLAQMMGVTILPSTLTSG